MFVNCLRTKVNWLMALVVCLFLLSSFALFYDDPNRINSIEARFAAVTPELIRQTAQEYLRPTNRTVLTVVPKG